MGLLGTNFQHKNSKSKKKHYITLLGAVVTLAVQIISGSLPLGALVGLGVIFGFRARLFIFRESQRFALNPALLYLARCAR